MHFSSGNHFKHRGSLKLLPSIISLIVGVSLWSSHVAIEIPGGFVTGTTNLDGHWSKLCKGEGLTKVWGMPFFDCRMIKTMQHHCFTQLNRGCICCRSYVAFTIDYILVFDDFVFDACPIELPIVVPVKSPLDLQKKNTHTHTDILISLPPKQHFFAVYLPEFMCFCCPIRWEFPRGWKRMTCLDWSVWAFRGPEVDRDSTILAVVGDAKRGGKATKLRQNGGWCLFQIYVFRGFHHSYWDFMGYKWAIWRLTKQVRS